MSHEFFKFGDGQKISYNNLKSLKKDDLAGDKSLQQLFSIFDSNGNGVLEVENTQGVKELDGLWNKIKTLAGKNNNSVFESSEAQELLTEAGVADKIQTSKLYEFLGVFLNKKPQTIQAENFVKLTDAQAKEGAVSILETDIQESYKIFNSQDNGWVTQGYDALKNYFDSDLGSSNVEEALALNAESLEFLKKAENKELTKTEFYLENLDHLKKMLKRRIFQFDGFDKFIPKNLSKDSISPEEFINNYIDHMLNGMSLEDIKKNQHKMCQMNTSQTEVFVENILKNAFGGVNSNEAPQLMNTPIVNYDIPKEYSSSKLVSFEEVYKIERGVEFSKEAVERVYELEYDSYLTEVAINKNQTFGATVKDLSDNVLPSNISIEDKAKQVLEFLKLSFTNPLDSKFTEEKLLELIKQSSSDIALVKNEAGELEFDLTNSGTPIGDLLGLLETAQAEYQKNMEGYIGGSIEDRLRELSQTTGTAHKLAYGEDFSKSLVQAMENDNVTAISRYTGGASTAGMLISSVGGLLCLTPAAPLGAMMVPVGNTMAMGGMAGGLILNTAEISSQNEVTAQEFKSYRDNMLTTIGGFVAGMFAGKIGDKAFKNLIDPKLVDTAKELIKGGNTSEAIKLILTDSNMLKNLSKSFGAKVGMDFGISLSADLIMMGALDTDETISDLIKSNLIGIVVGTTNDIAGFSRSVRGIDADVKTEAFVYKPDMVEAMQRARGRNADLDQFVFNNMDYLIKDKAEFISQVSKFTSNSKFLKSLESFSDADFASLKRMYTTLYNDKFWGKDCFENYVKIVERLWDSQKDFPTRSFSEDLEFLSNEIGVEPSIIPEFISTRRKAGGNKIPAILDETVGITWFLDSPSCPKDPEFLNVIKKVMLAEADEPTKVARIRDLKDNLYIITEIENNMSAVTDPEIKKGMANVIKELCLNGGNNALENEGNVKLVPLSRQLAKLDKFNSTVKTPALKEHIQTWLKVAFYSKEPQASELPFKLSSRISKMADIDECISRISDEKAKKVIENFIQTTQYKLNDEMHDSVTNFMEKLTKIVDAYNNLEGNYVTIDDTYYREYLSFLEQVDPDLRKQIRGELEDDIMACDVTNPNSNPLIKIFKKFLGDDMGSKAESRFREHIDEFNESQRVEQLVDYCKDNNDDVSKYLYKEVYLKRDDFTPEIRKRLADIADEYGVKIFPNKEYGDIESALGYIEYELYSWTKASNGNLKYPTVLDCTTSKRDYIDDKSAYGGGTTAGFYESWRRAISLNKMTYSSVAWSFRHEFMHANDLARLSSFEDGFVATKVNEAGETEIDAPNCKFYDDFVKLGISKSHIPYAYNNPMEFIAVAAESEKIFECSPEFRQQLIDFGMPEWFFDVK